MSYRINGKKVTKEEWDASPKVGITPGKTIQGISRQAFVSPVDGTVIRGAADLTAHEREHGIIQVGNEYVGIVKEKRAAAKEASYERAKQMQRDAKHFSYQ